MNNFFLILLINLFNWIRSTKGQNVVNCFTDADCANSGVCCGTAEVLYDTNNNSFAGTGFRRCFNAGSICCDDNNSPSHQMAAACTAGYSCSFSTVIVETFYWFCIPPKLSCFASDQNVIMKSGENKLISNVTIGETILSYSLQSKSLSYSDIISIPHENNLKAANFKHILTEKNKSIKVTEEHLILSGSCNGKSELTPASKIKINDCLFTVDGEEKVISISDEINFGLYTVVTENEFIIVNGIVASPFAVNHFIPNMFYNIHRILYIFMPSILRTQLLSSFAIVANEITVLLDMKGSVYYQS